MGLCLAFMSPLSLKKADALAPASTKTLTGATSFSCNLTQTQPCSFMASMNAMRSGWSSSSEVIASKETIFGPRSLGSETFTQSAESALPDSDPSLVSSSSSFVPSRSSTATVAASFFSVIVFSSCNNTSPSDINLLVSSLSMSGLRRRASLKPSSMAPRTHSLRTFGRTCSAVRARFNSASPSLYLPLAYVGSSLMHRRAASTASGYSLFLTWASATLPQY